MNRLLQHLESMVALESQVEMTLAEVVDRGITHPGADALLRRVHTMGKDQHAALSARLEVVGSEGSDADAPGTVPALGDLMRVADSRSATTASFALHTVSTMLNHAIFGYTILQALAHRYRDSWRAGGENTGDISEQHTRNYVAVAQEINQLIHDVVLWELSQSQDECRCSCPSCSLGLCLCSVSSRKILNKAWTDTAPVRRDGVLVQQPRSGSAAAIAGLREGEVVLAADGQVIHDYTDLHGVVREHQTGEDITLRVQRGGSETLDIVVTKT